MTEKVDTLSQNELTWLNHVLSFLPKAVAETLGLDPLEANVLPVTVVDTVQTREALLQAPRNIIPAVVKSEQTPFGKFPNEILIHPSVIEKAMQALTTSHDLGNGYKGVDPRLLSLVTSDFAALDTVLPVTLDVMGRIDDLTPELAAEVLKRVDELLLQDYRATLGPR